MSAAEQSLEPNRASGKDPSGQSELSKEAFEYMMRHDVPGIVDGICKVLLQQRPVDPYRAVTMHFNALQAGKYFGGVALGGFNSSGAWLRTLTPEGVILARVDQIPSQLHSDIQLMTSVAKEHSVFIAAVDVDEKSQNYRPGDLPEHVPNTCIRKYDAATGQLVDTYSCGGRAISCVTCDRERNHLWVFFRAVPPKPVQPGQRPQPGVPASAVVLQPSNGAVLRDIAGVPHTLAAQFQSGFVFLLTNKSIEKRLVETMVLESVTHLPESMARPTCLVVTARHVWCASANNDGGANFAGVFELNGRPVNSILPLLRA
jgi:hypothetical protein